MTDAEWLVSKVPRWMFKALGSGVGNRKARLLATACCLRLGALLPRASVSALAINERFADGASMDDDLARAARSARAAYNTAERAAVRDRSRTGRSHAAWAVWAALRLRPDTAGPDESGTRPAEWAAAAVRMAGVALNPGVGSRQPAGLQGGTKAERAAQADLIRDVFGNPFRPVYADPRWLTSTVLSLAQSIYSDRAFDRLPILADVLEEAGCDDPDILTHLRSDGPHVRGCWAVDLVLGKQ